MKIIVKDSATAHRKDRMLKVKQKPPLSPANRVEPWFARYPGDPKRAAVVDTRGGMYTNVVDHEAGTARYCLSNKSDSPGNNFFLLEHYADKAVNLYQVPERGSAATYFCGVYRVVRILSRPIAIALERDEALTETEVRSSPLHSPAEPFDSNVESDHHSLLERTLGGPVTKNERPYSLAALGSYTPDFVIRSDDGRRVLCVESKDSAVTFGGNLAKLEALAVAADVNARFYGLAGTQHRCVLLTGGKGEPLRVMEYGLDRQDEASTTLQELSRWLHQA